MLAAVRREEVIKLVFSPAVVSEQPNSPAHVPLGDIPLHRKLKLLVALHFLL